MTTSSYMSGRKKYQRPQAMLWSNNPGTLDNGIYVPQGLEIGGDESGVMPNEFLILSDDNRSSIDFKINRIENRKRMINGRMRSYHVADKLSISVSWDMLPSRSFALYPDFGDAGTAGGLLQTIDHDGNALTPTKPVKPYGSLYYADQQYTTDGGAGGVEMLNWYEEHAGPFWVYLAYDKYSNFSGSNNSKLAHLSQYNEVIEMYFADFSYSVVKRGGSNYDFWNISVSLEEA